MNNVAGAYDQVLPDSTYFDHLSYLALLSFTGHVRMIDVWKIGGSIPACIGFIVKLPTNTFQMQVAELLNAASYINHFIPRALVTKNFQCQ